MFWLLKITHVFWTSMPELNPSPLMVAEWQNIFPK